MDEQASVAVTLTATETHQFRVPADWFADDVDEDCTREELWGAMVVWNGERPRDLINWIDGEPTTFRAELVRGDGAPQVLTTDGPHVPPPLRDLIADALTDAYGVADDTLPLNGWADGVDNIVEALGATPNPPVVNA